MLSFYSGVTTFAGASVAPQLRTAGASMMAKSVSLPFLEAPPALDGSLAGDVVSRNGPLLCQGCAA